MPAHSRFLPERVTLSDTGRCAGHGWGSCFRTGADGNVLALDSTNGRLLWKFQTGERIKSSPMSYTVNGRQQMAISAGSVLFAFALPE